MVPPCETARHSFKQFLYRPHSTNRCLLVFFECRKMRIATNFHCLTVLKSRYSTVRYHSELFVSRLSFYTKYEEFREMFAPYGNIKKARLIMDKEIGRTKGFGFIAYETEAEAQNAIKALNGKIVEGRLLFVQPVTNSKADGNDARSKRS